ncbi:hypothetical protein GCM10027444_10370 [Actinopolyspora lacussalsi]
MATPLLNEQYVVRRAAARALSADRTQRERADSTERLTRVEHGYSIRKVMGRPMLLTPLNAPTR